MISLGRRDIALLRMFDLAETSISPLELSGGNISQSRDSTDYHTRHKYSSQKGYKEQLPARGIQSSSNELQFSSFVPSKPSIFHSNRQPVSVVTPMRTVVINNTRPTTVGSIFIKQLVSLFQYHSILNSLENCSGNRLQSQRTKKLMAR